MGLIFVERFLVKSVWQSPTINVRINFMHIIKIGIIGMMLLRLVDAPLQLIKILLKILREWTTRVCSSPKAKNNSILWLYDAIICHRLTKIVKPIYSRLYYYTRREGDKCSKLNRTTRNKPNWRHRLKFASPQMRLFGGWTSSSSIRRNFLFTEQCREAAIYNKLRINAHIWPSSRTITRGKALATLRRYQERQGRFWACSGDNNILSWLKSNSSGLIDNCTYKLSPL